MQCLEALCKILSGFKLLCLNIFVYETSKETHPLVFSSASSAFSVVFYTRKNASISCTFIYAQINVTSVVKYRLVEQDRGQ